MGRKALRRWLMLMLCLYVCSVGAGAQQARLDNADRLVQTEEAFTPVERVYRRSHALLIGINRYKNRPRQSQLSYADNDVEELKQLLIAHYGFAEADITLLEDDNATCQSIRDALSDLSDPDKVGPEDRVLVFFAGHGQTVKLPSGGDMGFLIPSDAAPINPEHPENPTPYQKSCLAMQEIWTKLESSPAKHVLLLADACYSGLAGARYVPEARLAPRRSRSGRKSVRCR